MIAHRHQARGDAAAVLGTDRDLDQLGVAARPQAPRLAPLAALDLEQQRLVGQARAHQQARGVPDLDGRDLGEQHRGQRQRRRLRAGHHQLSRGGAERPEVVARLVTQPVGAWRQRRQLQLGHPLRVVAHRARPQLPAVAKTPQRLGGRVRFRPARALAVARGLEGARRRRRRRLVGR